MKHLIALIAIIFALTCCRNSNNAPISEATFTHILADMHTAEGAAEGEFPSTKDSLLRIYYAQILKKHEVTQTDFDSTLAVYTRKPVVFDSLYSAVLREIQKIDTTTTH
ncbi:MAG: DUF4296 domain-containing protein [Saprospiraceae bacterium]|nr:DUF4296 domain-containing protein [Saprospiraceae bacterium]